MSRFRGHLPPEMIRALYRALVDSGLVNNRRALYAGIDVRFAASLSNDHRDQSEVLADLNKMNGVSHLQSGTVPLETMLDNAILLAGGLPEQVVFQRALDAVLAGAVLVEPPRPLLEAEIREELLFEDDLVPASFLAGGAKAAESIAQIRVPELENGAPVLRGDVAQHHLGTAWLISRSLVVTNHHVIAARSAIEQPCSESDFRAQALKAELKLDFDAATSAGMTVGVAALEAFDAKLDYAILRLAAPVDRDWLRLAEGKFELRAGERRAVNIIQHPLGGPKKVAIRNNLVTEVDEVSLRYFAGTQNGSSGSPVFDDRWMVVALHSSSRFVENMRFQGRPVAWVNRGILISAVLDELRARNSGLFEEIRLAPSRG